MFTFFEGTSFIENRAWYRKSDNVGERNEIISDVSPRCLIFHNGVLKVRRPNQVEESNASAYTGASCGAGSPRGVKGAREPRNPLTRHDLSVYELKMMVFGVRCPHLGAVRELGTFLEHHKKGARPPRQAPQIAIFEPD